MHRTSLIIAATVTLGIVAASVQAAPPGEGRQVTLDAAIGPAFLLHSRSNAIGHLFKPELHLGARLALSPRLSAGGVVTALLDESAHYRVLGALALVRYDLWQGARWAADVRAGLGLGNNADILHADLRASAPVLPYGLAGVGLRRRLGPASPGLQVTFENLGILMLGLSGSYDL